MEVTVLSAPAGMALSGDKQQVEQPDQAHHQADKEQLSEGRDQEPRKNLGGQAEMPGGWEKARKADPVKTREQGESEVQYTFLKKIQT